MCACHDADAYTLLRLMGRRSDGAVAPKTRLFSADADRTGTPMHPAASAAAVAARVQAWQAAATVLTYASKLRVGGDDFRPQILLGALGLSDGIGALKEGLPQHVQVRVRVGCSRERGCRA